MRFRVMHRAVQDTTPARWSDWRRAAHHTFEEARDALVDEIEEDYIERGNTPLVGAVAMARARAMTGPWVEVSLPAGARSAGPSYAGLVYRIEEVDL